MSEILHRSFRVDSELFDAATALAAERGESFSGLVVSLLVDAVEGKSAAVPPDARRLEGELSKLTEALRAERLTHSELTESLLSFARLTREMEQERQRMKALAGESIEGLEEAQDQLQEMVKLGGFASEKCREAVAGMEASLARMESLAGKTVPKFEEGLRVVADSSASIAQAGKEQVEGFEGAAGRIMESFRQMKKEFQDETKAQAHAFVLKTARRWQWITAAVSVCLLAGVGASFSWNHFSQKDAIREAVALQRQSEREVYFFLKEACNGRRVSVDKRYCTAGVNEKTFENPYR
jgi:hypothetical protein